MSFTKDLQIHADDLEFADLDIIQDIKRVVHINYKEDIYIYCQNNMHIVYALFFLSRTKIFSLNQVVNSQAPHLFIKSRAILADK